MVRRYLAYRPSEVGRICRLVRVLGMVPSIACLPVRWVRLGLPVLSNLAGPIQHFKSAIRDAWRDKVAAGLCSGRVQRWSAS